MMDKRQFITLGRIIKTGAINFVRNAWLAVAAIAVMAITLTIVLFSVIANATFANTVDLITDRIDISVYLKDSVTEDQRNQLISQLRDIPNVEAVNYISKDDALEAYKQQNVDNPELLAAISQTDNPLPASLQVKPDDPNKIDEIRQFLERPEIKEMQSDETSYSGDRKEAIDKITQATSFFRTAGVVGVVVFAVISILIIFNTIRMAIFNRRDELTIMRLLGASTWYIRGPFVVETILYGIAAATISIVLVYALFRAGSQAFNTSVFDIVFANQYLNDHFWSILGLQFLIGVLIGAVSSTIATRRYLKFQAVK